MGLLQPSSHSGDLVLHHFQQKVGIMASNEMSVSKHRSRRVWIVVVVLAVLLIGCVCVVLSMLRHHTWGEPVTVGSWVVTVVTGQTSAPIITYGGTPIVEGNIMTVSLQIEVENDGNQDESFLSDGLWQITEGSQMFACAANVSTFEIGVEPGATQQEVVICTMVPRASQVTLTLTGLSIFPVSWDLTFTS